MPWQLGPSGLQVDPVLELLVKIIDYRAIFLRTFKRDTGLLLVGNNLMYRVGVLGPFLDTEIRLGSAATVDSSLLVVIYAK